MLKETPEEAALHVARNTDPAQAEKRRLEAARIDEKYMSAADALQAAADEGLTLEEMPTGHGKTSGILYKGVRLNAANCRSRPYVATVRLSTIVEGRTVVQKNVSWVLPWGGTCGPQ